MRKIVGKIKNRKGESLAETLISLTIAAVVFVHKKSTIVSDIILFDNNDFFNIL